MPEFYYGTVIDGPNFGQILKAPIPKMNVAKVDRATPTYEPTKIVNIRPKTYTHITYHFHPDHSYNEDALIATGHWSITPPP